MTAASDPGEPAGPRPGVRNPSLMVGVLAFCGSIVALMQTLVVPILPELPRIFGAPAEDTSWIMTATLLAAAVSHPVVGRLGDMYGKRRMVLAVLALMVTGSVICGLSTSLPWVVAGRALQGLAIGVVPLGISIMRDNLGPERLGSAMALMSATLGFGGAIGLPLAAVIAEHAHWHALFWVSGSVGALDIVLVYLFVRESPVRARARFDLLGAVWLTVGLSCLLLGITKGGSWGWGSAATLGLFAAAAVLLPAWGVYELRRPAPLVDLRTSARRPVLFTNLASILVGFSIMVMSLVLPHVLQAPEATGYGFGLSMLEAGLILGPSGVVSMVLPPVSARISRRFGPKVSLMLGGVLMGVTYFVAAVTLDSLWKIVITSSVIGAGLALAYAAMPDLIMRAVPVTETAAANGLNALMRAVGTSTSSAVTSAVMANMTITLGPVTLTSLAGIQTTMVIAGVAGLLGVLVAALIPARPAVPEPAATGAPARSAAA